MVNTTWSTDNFTDPICNLTDGAVQKRYHAISKILHPDVFSNPSQTQLATETLTKLVNPSYTKIKKEDSRKEVRLLLKLKAETNFSTETEVKTEYEYRSKVLELALHQYVELEKLELVIRELEKLNLAYLQLLFSKSDKCPPCTDLPISVVEKVSKTLTPPDVARESYDQKHYERAKQYAHNGNWSEVVSELIESIKINPELSQYHSLLGFAYLNLKMKGMARAYLKRALQLDPKDALATCYLPRCN